MSNVKHQTARASQRPIQGFALAPLYVFLACNFTFLPLAFLLHRDVTIRLVYDTNTLVFPVIFGTAAAARMASPRRRLAALWLTAAVLLASVRVYATHIEPNNLQLREVLIHSEKIDRPFTLLHLSDIQSGGIGPYEEKVFDKVRALNPDLILHTGDFLQPRGGLTRQGELPKLAALFETLDPPLGMFTVEGESDTALVNFPPERMGGIRFLNSEVAELRAGKLHIRLLGLSLAHSFKRHSVPMALVDNWLAKSPPDAINIAFGHRPDFIPPLLDKPIDLCLAGHTHGGQVRVPFIGPLTTASGTPKEWSRGYRELGQTRINVSAGIGASHFKGLPSIRFNCPPEITLIRFEPQKLL
jgi:predicted MPP superfamily phosphohydrolase